MNKLTRQARAQILHLLCEDTVYSGNYTSYGCEQ